MKLKLQVRYTNTIIVEGNGNCITNSKEYKVPYILLWELCTPPPPCILFSLTNSNLMRQSYASRLLSL